MKIKNLMILVCMLLLMSSVGFSAVEDLEPYILTYLSGDDADSETGYLTDISGNENHGVVFGTDGTRTGILNEAYDLDGTTDYVKIENLTSNQYNTSFSVSGWFKLDQVNTPRTLFYNGNGATATDGDYWLFFDNSGSGSTNFLVSRVYKGGASSESRTSTLSINTTDWIHVTLTNDAGSYAKIYINGVDDSSLWVSKAGELIGNANPLWIGKSYVYSQWDGGVDEFVVFNKTLSPTEVLELHNDGVPYNFFAGGEVEKESTSLKSAFTNVIDDDGIVVSTTDYNLIGNFTFNLTSDTDLYLKSSGYISGSTNTLNSLYLKYENSEVLFDDKVSSIDSTTKFRQFNNPVLKYSGTAGSNNVLIYAKKVGVGNINLYNLDLIIDTNLTDNSTAKVYQFEGTKNISSTSLINVYNYTFNKETLTSNYIGDSSLKLTSFSNNENLVTCVYQFNGINITSPMERTLKYNGDVGSMGVSGFVNGSSNPTLDANISLMCKGSISDTFQVDAYDTIQMLEAVNNKVVNGKIYYMSENNATAGLNTILTFDYLPINSTKINIPFSMTLLSLTGSQEGSKTPIINMSVDGLTCSESFKRSLDDDADYSSIKGILFCDGLTLSVNHTLRLTALVGSSETLVVKEVSASVYEVQSLDISSTPPPLSFNIITPEEDEVYSNTLTYSQNVLDTLGVGYNSEIILYYSNASLVEVLVNDTNNLNISTFNINTINYANDNYYITSTINDGVTNVSKSVDFVMYNPENVIYPTGSYGQFVCPDNTQSILNFWFGVGLCCVIIWLGNNYQVKIIGFIGVFGLFYLSLVYYGCNSMIGTIGIALCLFLFMAITQGD